MAPGPSGGRGDPASSIPSPTKVDTPTKLDSVSIVGLLLGEIDQLMRAKFLELLRHYAWPAYRRYAAGQKSQEQKLFDTMCGRLSNFDNFAAIRIIWKESPFVTDAELALVGFRRSFSGSKPLSRYSLGTTLWQAARCKCEGACDCEEPDQGGYRAQANRLVEALLSFQLVAEAESGHPKVLTATPLLNAIMRDYAVYCNRLLETRLLHRISVCDEEAGQP